jgi:hypothetical protein
MLLLVVVQGRSQGSDPGDRNELEWVLLDDREADKRNRRRTAEDAGGNGATRFRPYLLILIDTRFRL